MRWVTDVHVMVWLAIAVVVAIVALNTWLIGQAIAAVRSERSSGAAVRVPYPRIVTST